MPPSPGHPAGFCAVCGGGLAPSLLGFPQWERGVGEQRPHPVDTWPRVVAPRLQQGEGLLAGCPQLPWLHWVGVGVNPAGVVFLGAASWTRSGFTAVFPLPLRVVW